MKAIDFVVRTSAGAVQFGEVAASGGQSQISAEAGSEISLNLRQADVAGYARALEWFDREIGRVMARLRPGDLMILTADHGNDPTWSGTDHTRERVAVLAKGLGARSLGLVGFADVAASVAAHLGVPAEGPGRSFL